MKKKRKTLSALSPQQRLFVAELLASDRFNAAEAARKAGYKDAPMQAYRLLKKPAIAEALGRAQREREARCELKGDDVLAFLRSALFLNPLRYFAPSEDGGWLLTDPSELPEEVGRLIESMDVRVVEGKDGSRTSTFAVKLVSKTHVLGLAMKHLGLLPDKVSGLIKQVVQVDWNNLLLPPPPSSPVDLLLAQVEREANLVEAESMEAKP